MIAPLKEPPRRPLSQGMRRARRWVASTFLDEESVDVGPRVAAWKAWLFAAWVATIALAWLGCMLNAW